MMLQLTQLCFLLKEKIILFVTITSMNHNHHWKILIYKENLTKKVNYLNLVQFNRKKIKKNKWLK